jgi:ATP-binding cassette subfamily B (MDR/TAP) protein 1
LLRYNHEVHSAFKEETRFYTISSFSTAVPYLPLFVMIAFAFGYGAQLIREGEISRGPIVLRVFFGIVLCAEGFGQAVPYFTKYQEARTVAAEIFEVISRPSSIDSFSSDGLLIGW